MEKFQGIKFEQNSVLSVKLTTRTILFIVIWSSVIGVQGSNIHHGVLNPRVIGGVDATPGKTTNMVALVRNGKFDCGGSIINSDTILTAAHCVQPQDRYIVRAGSMFWNKGGILFKTTWMKQHPEYNLNQPKNFDIGIIRIAGKFAVSNDITIGKLVSGGTPRPIGKIATVNGWGVINVDPPQFPKIMQTVALVVISNKECDEVFPGEITEEMMCAGTQGEGKDACFGDSGGPLLVDNVQYGIVSWGPDGKCASSEQPYGVYAYIGTLREWIDKNSEAKNP